jgi:Mlc titration factor MtfA (ptsG expression regulator)
MLNLDSIAVEGVAGALVLTALVFGRRLLPYLRLPPRRYNHPVPIEWARIITSQVALAARLFPGEKARLLQLTAEFIRTKTFEGCGGLILSEEMKVVIAAQACLLLLHLDGDVYPKIDTILVYPHPFVPERVLSIRQSFSPVPVPQPLLGEAWMQGGTIVLAWDDVLHGAVDFADPGNVVLHEFAHALDDEDGSGNGTPLVESPAALRSWARVLQRDYAALQADADAGRVGVLNLYGATNPAEFFAVATEAFFKRPRDLLRSNAELYAELKRFYGQDPASVAARESESRGA